MSKNILKEGSQRYYANYRIYHPDGDLMFYCSKQRFNWYVKRNLAIIISDREAQLMFFPKGKGENPNILKPRENRCVNCGSYENLSKHHIIPKIIRQIFPEEYKSRNSADVVILCRDCHDEYEQKPFSLREEVNRIKDKYCNDYAYIRQRIHTLKKYDIPEEKRILYRKQIDAFLEANNVTEEMIYDVRNFKGKNIPPVIEYVNKIGVENIILLCKRHFAENMELKYLPDWWSADIIFKKNMT